MRKLTILLIFISNLSYSQTIKFISYNTSNKTITEVYNNGTTKLFPMTSMTINNSTRGLQESYSITVICGSNKYKVYYRDKNVAYKVEKILTNL